MIDWIFIGFGVITASFYYIFKQFQKNCNSSVLLIENNTEENEIPPSYEEAVQNTE